MTLRVVNLGLPKSGTTTLAHALNQAGLRVADYRVRRSQTKDTSLHRALVADLIYKGYFQTGDPGAFLTDFDAISETSFVQSDRSLWPQMDFALLRALRTYHPDLHFVASRRETFELSQSMLAWSNLGTTRLPEAAIPGLPAGYGETSKEREQWIDAHYANLAAFFANDPKYLEYDTAAPDAQARLSGFLGIELPWWGRANENPLNKRRKQAKP